MFIRIELWSVRKQIKEAQSASRTLHKITNFRGTMNGVVIHDQEYRLRGSCHKALEKCNENRGGYIVFSGHKTHGTSGTDAEIKSTLCLAPVVVKTGVLPRGAQVVPE